jgi:hypothetical protein
MEMIKQILIFTTANGMIKLRILILMEMIKLKDINITTANGNA